MCTKILICYGNSAPDETASSNCEARPFYITTDGKYAIPVENVKFNEDNEPIYPEDGTAKLEISILKDDFGVGEK